MGLFDILSKLSGVGIATAYGITAPIPKNGKKTRKRTGKTNINIAATAYGITAPVSVVVDAIKDLSKNDKKLCRYCGTEIRLEDKFCFKCGKKLGYLNENESHDEDE